MGSRRRGGIPDLASALTALKDRSGLSYAQLATRCWLSASTVHRYCQGKVVPAEFGTVERIALACGAERAEVDDLYPLWSRANSGPPAPDSRPAPRIHEPVAQAAPVGAGRAARRHRRWAALLGALFLVAALSPSSTPRHVPVASQRPRPQTVAGPAWEQYPAAVPSAFFGVTINSNTGLMPGFRYAGRIDAYELWAFAPSPHFYSGDADTLARMTRRAVSIVRRADPKATPVCLSMGDLWTPASQRFLLDFAAAGSYRDCDAAGVKLYPQHDGDTPESLVALADLIDRTFHSAGVHPALWNTGSAYRVATARPLDAARSIAYAVRFYLIGMYVRYARTYFYNWGGTKVPLVLQAAGGPPTEAARAVATLQQWLAGAGIVSCGHGTPAGLPGTVWQCRFLLATPVGRPQVPAVVRWTESGTASMPVDPGDRSVRYLDGRTIAAPRRLTVTEMPQLDVEAPGDPVLSSGSGSAR
ncbi:helix-turn-helix domain-containing protein [Streptomyces sp. HUAS TT7]|uniref:helix-turn-helix domain-containing protein n=1 Tax=Streptomyces sp. HUAS TT7 TaxID=3447507 RepID=UPI003F65ACC1